MTKEEIIQAISDDKMMPFIQPEQLAGIVDFVIKNCRPSFPADLEDAADEHIRRVADAAGHPGWDWTTQDIAEAFIAGAEWGANHLRDSTKMIHDGLEEVAEEWATTTHFEWPNQVPAGKRGFIAGAEWGAAHARKEDK